MSTKFYYPPVCAKDYRELACRRVPRILFDYLDSGAFAETTIHANEAAYKHIHFARHLLRDVPASDTTTTLLGQTLAQPIILGPVGFAGFYARRGETQAAQAAAAAGVPLCLSTLSLCSLEEVKQASPAPFWFQMYMTDERETSIELMHRAKAAGCPVLVVTVDVPLFGIRYQDMRHGLFGKSPTPPLWRTKMYNAWQIISHPAWVIDVAIRGRPLRLGNITNFIKDINEIRQYRVTLGWEDIAWVRDNWAGKLVLKGVMHADDAMQAAALGLDGIVVSNHAGRHLDSTLPTISVLPSIAAAVGDKLDIIIDGGIFSGADVLKALALGADACMLGRAWVYALAARGGTGVSEVLSMLHTELATAMGLLGIDNIEHIDKNIIVGLQSPATYLS